MLTCVCELMGWGKEDSRDLLISHCEVSQGAVTESSHKIWWKKGEGGWLQPVVKYVSSCHLFLPPSLFSQLSIIITPVSVCGHDWHTSPLSAWRLSPRLASCWRKLSMWECYLMKKKLKNELQNSVRPLVLHWIHFVSFLQHVFELFLWRDI